MSELKIGPPAVTTYDRAMGQNGVLVPQTTNAPTSASTVALTANRAYHGRFRVSKPTTVTVIGFEVSTAAGADDEVAVALSTVSGTTLTRVATSGAVTGKLNATGYKSVSLTASYTCVPGVTYAVTLSSGTQGGTAASIRSLTVVSAAWNTALTEWLVGLTASAHPPGTSMTADTNSANIPALFVRES